MSWLDWLLSKNVISIFLSYIHPRVIYNLSLSNTQCDFFKNIMVILFYSWWVHDWINDVWFVNESFLQWISWFTKAVPMILLLNQMVLKFNSPTHDSIPAGKEDFQTITACFWSVRHTNLSNEFRGLLRLHRIHMNHFFGRFMLLLNNFWCLTAPVFMYFHWFISENKMKILFNIFLNHLKCMISNIRLKKKYIFEIV